MSHKDSWEEFDAEALFPPSRLHSNKLSKVDKRDMEYIPEEDFGEQEIPSSQEQTEPQDGDVYTNASDDTGHVDELFEMEGLEGGLSEEREISADKEEDRRTEEEPKAEFDEKEADSSKEDLSELLDSERDELASEPQDESGEEKPIQEESEEVEEVAESISETSEDVHGGNEATKDIEDSPNAANDGQDPDNQGAETGEGSEVDGEAGEGDSEGQGSGETSEGNTGNPLGTEDWEKKADQSSAKLSFLNSLEKIESKVRQEKGHRTSLPQYQFDNREEATPPELEVAFKKASELLKKFADEQDLTAKEQGRQRWDAEEIIRSMVQYRHQRIPSSKYQYQKEADICILLDISGSCVQQAEMFMAIAAGCIGDGVKVFVGYNGCCRASAMNPPSRRIRSYSQAKPWVQAEVNRVSGWDHQVDIGEWSFGEFVENEKPKTVIIFGDWDGIDQYQDVVSDPKFRSIKFFWFANEGLRHQQEVGCIPQGFTRKNYMPGIYQPRDFVKALRKIK